MSATLATTIPLVTAMMQWYEKIKCGTHLLQALGANLLDLGFCTG